MQTPDKQEPSRQRSCLLMPILLAGVIGGSIWFAVAWAKERGRRTICLNDLAQIRTAIAVFASEHENHLPERLSDMSSFFEIHGNHKLLICPSAVRRLPERYFGTFDDLRQHPEYISFVWLHVTNLNGGPVADDRKPIMCDKPGNHGRWWGMTHMLFADFRVTAWPGTIEDYARSNSLAITINTNWME